MLGQSQPTTAATTNTTRKNRVRLAFIFSPRHRASEGRGRSFLFSFHLSAQREQQGQPSEQEEYNHRRPSEPTKTIARHRPVEIFFHQIAQHQTENHRRPGITETAHEVTEGAES